ncbi:MAG: hypothetical protein OEZ55_02680 [Nitrospinota bacterium]|nr:hypothetical protein [Nitrospinota bacterium]MDH5755558.1 hypothetical protein [Nitrospinota bacterium]
MKRAKKTVTRTSKKSSLAKQPVKSEKEIIYGKTHCYHCGGMLRVLPDEVSCVNCGRLDNHKCERCMYKEMEMAV